MELSIPIPLSSALEVCRSLIQGGVDSPSTRFFSRLDSPEYSGGNSLTFIHKGARRRMRGRLEAAYVFFEKGTDSGGLPGIEVSSIYECIRLLGNKYRDQFKYPKETSSTEVRVHPTAVVEGVLKRGVSVGAHCYVGPHCVIAENTILESRVTIYEGCEIGQRCRLQSGSVIGAEGFGFYPHGDTVRHLPHYAGVILGEDVWIGANTVIAGGVLNPTRVAPHCKLDSLVQVGHNVEIGRGGLIAAQVGIAGSTVIGKNVKIGGAAGINGHIRLGDGVTIAALAGVTKDWEGPVTLSGFPAQPHGEWKRQVVRLRRDK